MIRSSHSFVLCALFLSLFSCGSDDKSSSKPSTPLGQHNPIIRGTPQKSVGHHITLEADALEQRFLMTTNYTIPDFPFPRTLASKIISFKKRGSELFMFESLAGKAYANTVNELFLARFPIVSETAEGAITFNFEEGMKHLFLQPNFYTNGMDYSESSYSISHSYVESVRLTESHILIDHSIRVEQPEIGTTPLVLRYALSTYNHNPEFPVAVLSPFYSEKVGYFQNIPILIPGQPEPTSLILKHNPANFPITYYITPNVPLPLMEAIRDGILYWNRALGQEMFTVDILPEDIDPNVPGHHIVYWLEGVDHINDIGGMADTTSDPLTGEILSSRVLIPSHLVNYFYQYSSDYIATKSAISEALPDASPGSAPLERRLPFHHPHNCQIMTRAHQNFKKHPKQLDMVKQSQTQEEMSPHEIDYYSTLVTMDIFRSIIAHEIGHTIPLRHNFAGSTQTDLNIENYDEIMQAYVKTGEVPEDLRTTSTVMDYTDNLTSALVGAQIRLQHPPFSYDKDSIRYLYLDEGNPLFFSSPYCSDEHFQFDPIFGMRSPLYQDCDTFDSFSNPTAWHFHQLSQVIKKLPQRVISEYQMLEQALAAASNEYEDPLQFFQKYPLTPKSDALILGHYFNRLVDSISQDAQFVQVSDKHFGVTGLNVNEYTQQTNDFINENIADLGGLSQILLAHLTAPEGEQETEVTSLRLTSTMEQKFETLLNEMMTAPSTPPSPFLPMLPPSKNEIDPEKKRDIIGQKVNKYLQIFEKEVLLLSAQILKHKQFATYDQAFTGNLSSIVERILFDKSSEVIDTFNGVEYSSPRFDYINRIDNTPSEDLRKEVVSLATHDFFPSNPHYQKEIEQISKNILQLHRDETKELLNHEDELSNELYDWLFFEKQRFDQITVELDEPEIVNPPAPTETTTPAETEMTPPPVQENGTEEAEEIPVLDEAEMPEWPETEEPSGPTAPTTTDDGPDIIST